MKVIFQRGLVWGFFLRIIIANSLLVGNQLIASTFVLPTPPANFVIETVVTGVDIPVGMAFAPDNRIFIAEKFGQVRTWQNGQLLIDPFLNLGNEVNSAADRGLLGIAVHPQFPAQPYVYLLYNHDPAGVPADQGGARVARLERVTADASRNYNVAATGPGARVIILGNNSTRANLGNEDTNIDLLDVSCQTGPASAPSSYLEDCLPSDFTSHAVGALRFGADGKLYVGLGDASSSFDTDPRALRAQELDSLAGKLLRIDPITGAGLPDNPFYNGNANSNRSKVLNYGLRNPYRFTFDPATGAPVMGDVGWDSYEELNIGRGKNFGWPCYEGSTTGSAQQAKYSIDPNTSARCQQLYNQGLNAVQAPAFSYSVLPGGAAIGAGVFYTGTAYPAQYQNKLFFFDYSRKWIKTLQLSGTTFSNLADFADNVEGIVDMQLGPDGNLHYVYIDGTPNGEVRRIRYVSGNTPPTAQASANRSAGALPLAVQFSSVGSFDPENQALSYVWDFGTGVTSTLANPAYTYTVAGNYVARLTVRDPLGATGSATLNIAAGNNRPVVTITTPISGTLYRVGDVMNVAASASDVENGNVSANIRWQIKLHHADHVHFDTYVLPNGASGSFTIVEHGDNTYLEICATAPDNSGLLSDERCVIARPVAATPTPTPQANVCVSNLLNNAGFESGLSGWNRWDTHSSNSSDAHSGSSALQIAGGAGGLSQHLAGSAGQSYTLKTWAKLSGASSGVALGINFYNSAWQLLNRVSTDTNNSAYTQFTTQATAPANTAIVEVYIWKSAAGTLAVDDACLTGATGPTATLPPTPTATLAPTLTPTPNPQTPTPTPTAGAGVCSANQLGNGGFEADFANWNRWDANSAITNQTHTGLKAARLGTGAGGLGQVRPASAGQNLTLQWWAQRSADAGGASGGLNFYDAQWNLLDRKIANINGSAYVAYAVQGVAPANTANVEAWFYKSANGSADADDFCLTLGGGATPTPTPTTVGPSPTPTPTPPVGVCSNNLVINPGFESQLSGWSRWDTASSIDPDAHIGAAALRLGTAQGGLGQHLVASAGQTFTLQAWSKQASMSSNPSIGLSFFDAQWAQLGNAVTAAVPATSYQPYTVQATAPANTAFVMIWAYKSAGGYQYMDDVCLTRAGGAGAVAQGAGFMRLLGDDVMTGRFEWQPLAEAPAGPRQVVFLPMLR